MSNQDFTKTFLSGIKPGQRVLDLGAGGGDFVRMFVDRGARVTAVDPRIPEIQDVMINSKRMEIEEFCAAENPDRYDLIFARNVIQFLDKNWTLENLFPWMEEHTSQQGIIAIETFYKDPEPPFDHPMRALYTLGELMNYFMPWKDIHAREYSHQGLDMNGQARKFFVSSLIVQRT